MRDVAVIGIGMNKWGELWEKSISDLIAESALLALDDAGIDKVDAMYIGCMSSGLFIDQEHLGSIGPDYTGLCPTPGIQSGIGLRLGRSGLPFRISACGIGIV